MGEILDNMKKTKQGDQYSFENQFYEERIEELEAELEKARKKAKKWKKKYKKLKSNLSHTEGSTFPYDAFTFDYEVTPTVPDACKYCTNHPSNGGSGNCNCTLGGYKVTC